jgi:DNA repair protein RadC
MSYLDRVKDLNNNSTTIKNWPLDDRPREKLLLKGSKALSHSELLAILIGKGTHQKTAVDLAKELMHKANNSLTDLGRLDVQDLVKIKGIGEAKAIALCAAMELGRRRQASDALEKPQITRSDDIARFMEVKLKDEKKEVFAILLLNNANKIIHFEVISEGGLTSTVADPRVIFRKALEKEAVNIILAHNHPSGTLKPSRADVLLTNKIRDAAWLFDMKIIDHIIVGQGGYYSFADEGML